MLPLLRSKMHFNARKHQCSSLQLSLKCKLLVLVVLLLICFERESILQFQLIYFIHRKGKTRQSEATRDAFTLWLVYKGKKNATPHLNLKIIKSTKNIKFISLEQKLFFLKQKHSTIFAQLENFFIAQLDTKPMLP